MTELQAAGAYLASRRALVVLDNCEHLLEACAEATEALLQAAPELVVLATSRAPLGVAGETDWRVPSLSLPGGAARSDGGLAGSDAVALFVERRGRGPPRPCADGPSDAGVCGRDLHRARRAAAGDRARRRPGADALGRADRDAASPTASACSPAGRGPPLPRLKTLRASVDWSHELLSDDERALLRRLAVFAGGFTLEAAEEVCAGDGVERERRARPARLAGRPVAGDRRGAGLARSATACWRPCASTGSSGSQRPARQKPLRARHRDHFLALAEQAAPAARDRPPARVARGCSTPRRPTWRRRSTTRCAATRRWRCASARRSIGGGARAVASPRPSWRIRARWTPAATASPRCAHGRFESRAYIAVWVGEFACGGGARDRGAGARRGGRRPKRRRRGRAAISGNALAVHEPPRGASGARARGRARPGGGRRLGARAAKQTTVLTYLYQSNTRRPPAPTRRSPRWPSGWATPSRSPGAGSWSL